MDDEEVSDLSARLNLAEFCDYHTALARRTVEIVRSLCPQALDDILDLHRLHAESIFWDNGLRVIVEREGQTKGW